MSYLLYNGLANVAYAASIPVLQRLRQKQPTEWGQRMGQIQLEVSDDERIWIHAASVGELKGVEPLVKVIRAREPSSPVVLSTMTRTGQSLAGQIPGVAATFFVPLDVQRVVRRGLEGIDARVLILVETEIWPNLLREAKRCGMRTAIVNGRISRRAYVRYRLLAGLLGEVLGLVDFIGVQSELDRERFERLGAPFKRIQVLGSSKYDAALPVRDEKLREVVKGFLDPGGDLPIWVAGCVRPGEEEPLLDAYRQVDRRQRHLLILAPRHLEQVQTLERALSARGLESVRWSRVREPGASPAAARVMVLDTIGELSSFYGLAAFAYVGGGIAPLGGHNPLEPAAFGIPVFFGHHMDTYQFPTDRLVNSGAGVRVETAAEIAEVIQHWLQQPDERIEAGHQAGGIAEEFRGSADRYVEVLRERGVLETGRVSAGSKTVRRVRTFGRPNIPPVLVNALSSVHQGVSAVRREAYRSGVRSGFQLRVPVISVGNLSLGGTGKTPMVAHLAQYYSAKGLRVAVVSRGYGRARVGKQPLVLGDGSRTDISWQETGDEPYWLAEKVPAAHVLVGSNRVQSGLHAQENLGAHLVILDDGFQHLRLCRDLDIVLLDRGSWKVEGHFAGEHWTREGLSALSDADVVCLSHSKVPEDCGLQMYLKKWFPHLVVIGCRHRPSALRQLRSGREVPLSVLEGSRVAAVSGLASPIRFEETLMNLGATVTQSWRYADHHSYSEEETGRITKESVPPADWVVTTEKDGVRLAQLAHSLENWLVLSVELEIIQGRKEFEETLDRITPVISKQGAADES